MVMTPSDHREIENNCLKYLISRSNMAVRSYGLDTDFRNRYVCTDLDLGDMTLVQGHDTTLGHGQQLREILSKSGKGVRSCGPDTM